jgi:hypothetical protein
MLARSLLLVAILAVGCAGAVRTPYLPDPQSSEHFRTTRAGFRLGLPSKVARYYIDFAVTEPFDEPVSARITFENPLDPKQPFVVERVLNPAETEFSVESPPLPAIQDRRVYGVLMTIHSTGSRDELARHAQSIRCVLPPQLE